MSLIYNKINVLVGSNNILCDSVNISEQSNQKALYALNYSLPYDYTPESLKSTITLSYFMEINNEPNYAIISNLKSSMTTGNTQVIVAIGNQGFTGYLSKLSFTVSPLQMVKVQASYDIFTPINAPFAQSRTAAGNNYNQTNGSGLPNYFSTYLYSGGTGGSLITNSNILQLDYNFSCTVVPIYSLSNVYPIQVYISEASEEISTISEIQNNPTFSGQNLISLLGVDTLQLTNQSSTWGASVNSLPFYISGMQHISEKIDINTSSLILFQDQWRQSF